MIHDGAMVNVTISTYNTTVDRWEYRTEAWARGGVGRLSLPTVIPPDGLACEVLADGRVSTYPSLRRKLGIGYVSGEGVSVAT